MLVESKVLDFILNTTLVGPATDIVLGSPPLQFAELQGGRGSRVDISIVGLTFALSLDTLLGWSLSWCVHLKASAATGTGNLLSCIL